MLRKVFFLFLFLLFSEATNFPIYAQTNKWDVTTEFVTEVLNISSNSPPF